MKNILTTCTIVFAILLATICRGHELDELYANYAGNKNVEIVNLNSGLLSLASLFLNTEDNDLKEVINSIDNIRVMISEDGATSQQISNEAIAILNTMDYEELIRVNDGGEKIRVLVKQIGDKVQELVVMVSDESESVLLQLSGDIDLDKVSDALNALDIDVDIDEALEDLE